MKHHQKDQQGVSLVDIKQIAVMQGSYVFENTKTKFNGQELYSVKPEGGLYTFEELKNRFLH